METLKIELEYFSDPVEVHYYINEPDYKVNYLGSTEICKVITTHYIGRKAHEIDVRPVLSGFVLDEILDTVINHNS